MRSVSSNEKKWGASARVDVPGIIVRAADFTWDRGRHAVVAASLSICTQVIMFLP